MKKLILVLSVLVLGSLSFAKTLTQQLEERAQQSAAKSPKEIKKTMSKALADLKASQIVKKAAKKGDTLKHFELPDVQKGMVSTKALLKKGPLVLVFYRGGWCPYCNLQLRDLQKNIDAINTAGAQLVAVSPEAPDNTQETLKKNKLGFYVLSDVKGSVSDSLGLTFELSKDLIELYKKFGIDLQKNNANKKWELPLAATYIINKNGKIVYAFVDEDYTKRPETTDLIKVLKKL